MGIRLNPDPWRSSEPAAGQGKGKGGGKSKSTSNAKGNGGKAPVRPGARTPVPARPGARHRKVLKYVSFCLAMIFLAVAATGYYFLHHVLGNVATVSLADLKDRPAASVADARGQTPLNILILGSQTRDGQTLATHVGNSTKDGTDLSDTAMLLHIAADRKWAEVVSIPRDLFVSIPACQDRNDPSRTDPAQSEAQFYDAMGEGGPACAVATVEQMTDIRVDHFVELTFDAFIQMTDAVGGVQVCVPEPGINDPDYSGLVLSAGLHTISGNEALAFVRDRHGLAGGMDTQRIRMQQMFMTSLFDKLTSNGTMENPITLYKLATTLSSDVTVDTGLDNLSTMISIAESVGSISKRYVQYLTAPYTLDTPGEYSYDPDGEHSSPGPGFDQLWTYLREDEPVPGSPAAAEFGASAASSPSREVSTSAAAAPSPTVALEDVHVAVYNGTDVSGEARRAATHLAALGMTASVGDSGYSGYRTTTIYYPSGDQAQADTLGKEVAGSVLKESPNVSELTLVMGTNAPSALVAAPSSQTSAAATASASATASISAEARDGDANLCSDLPGVVGYGGSPEG